MQHHVDKDATKPIQSGRVPPGEELIRLGDARAEAGDWIGAVARWRAAAAAGAEPAANTRLRAFVQRFDPTPPIEGGRVPRQALGSLAVCGAATVLGTLAFVAASRAGAAIYPFLLALGWVSTAIAAGSALVFALRSGRSDDGAAAAVPEPVGLDELTAQAEALAARLTRRGEQAAGSTSVAAR